MMTKLKIPARFYHAAQTAHSESAETFPPDRVVDIVRAVFQELAISPILPTNADIENLREDCPFKDYPGQVTWVVGEWQKRMVLAPEPEIPVEVKEITDSFVVPPSEMVKKALLGAYQCGKESK